MLSSFLVCGFRSTGFGGIATGADCGAGACEGWERRVTMFIAILACIHFTGAWRKLTQGSAPVSLANTNSPSASHQLYPCHTHHASKLILPVPVLPSSVIFRRMGLPGTLLRQLPNHHRGRRTRCQASRTLGLLVPATTASTATAYSDRLRRHRPYIPLDTRRSIRHRLRSPEY